jgi:hypothetical protein
MFFPRAWKQEYVDIEEWKWGVWQGMEEEETKEEEKVEWREDGDNLRMGVDTRSSSPSEESERCMTVYIPGLILILTRGGVLKVEAEKWGGIRNSVDTFVERSRSPYTLYLLAHSSHNEDLLSATIGFSRMVNDNKEVAIS